MIGKLLSLVKSFFSPRKEMTRNELLTAIGKAHRERNPEPLRLIPTHDHIVDFEKNNPVPKSYREALALSKKNREERIKEEVKKKQKRDMTILEAGLLRDNTIYTPTPTASKGKRRKKSKRSSGYDNSMDMAVINSITDSMF